MGQDLPPLQQICAECAGQKEFENPNWIRWYSGWDTAREQGQTWDEYEKSNPQPAEPEVYGCSECEGIGWVTTEAGLQILRLLNTFRPA